MAVPVFFVLGNFLGIQGVWISFGIAPLIMSGIFVLYFLIRYGKKKFPLLSDENAPNSYTFDFYLTENNIMNLRNQMEALLKEKHIDLDIIYRIMLLIEEMSLLIFQDDGVLFDITETDNPISSM